ncbi:hypothetical protein NPIL_697261 [Nephila pilipes]|uniref:Uncharacterized protein n=1 Tax=Nephila pilipes TaxID=299642 RepID=A0A8X6US92_NEPPI|nr:hypothetical protein NPIL_697261 [Nephila pilipes]
MGSAHAKDTPIVPDPGSPTPEYLCRRRSVKENQGNDISGAGLITEMEVLVQFKSLALSEGDDQAGSRLALRGCRLGSRPRTSKRAPLEQRNQVSRPQKGFSLPKDAACGSAFHR